MKNLFFILLVALISFSSCKKCETCYQYEYINSVPFGEETSLSRLFMEPEPLDIQEICGKDLKSIAKVEEEKAYNEYDTEYYIVKFWICEPEN